MDVIDNMTVQKVNALIKMSREMVKMIDDINRVSDNLDGVKTFVFAAMVAYYGFDYTDHVFLAFLKTNFIECSEPISRVIQNRYGLAADLSLEMSRHCPGTFYTVDGFKNLKNCKYRIRRSIYVSSEVDMTILVESILHQVNHVINSISNPVLKKSGKYGARMGISFDCFDTRRTEVLELEEAINKLQVNDILVKAEAFGRYQIEDAGVQAICNMLFEGAKDTLETVEDDMMTKLVRPLYQDVRFQQVLNGGRLSGGLGEIRDAFDDKTFTGAYSKFLTACDRLGKNGLSTEAAAENESVAKSLVKKYTERV